MQFKQITEDAPAKDIRNMVSTIALSLIASGREQVNIKSLIKEIKKRTNIDVPYNVMMDILNDLPFVTSASADVVTFTNTEDESSPEPSSKDVVQDMATKAASSSLKQ